MSTRMSVHSDLHRMPPLKKKGKRGGISAWVDYLDLYAGESEHISVGACLDTCLGASVGGGVPAAPSLKLSSRRPRRSSRHASAHALDNAVGDADVPAGDADVWHRRLRFRHAFWTSAQACPWRAPRRAGRVSLHVAGLHMSMRTSERSDLQRARTRVQTAGGDAMQDWWVPRAHISYRYN